MLTINIPTIDQPTAKAKALIADRRLYLARDESTVIEVGDPRAAFLLCAAGQPIAGPDVERLKLSIFEGRVVQNAPESPAAPASEPEKETEKETEKAEVPAEPEKVEAPDPSAATGKREKK